VKLQDSIRGNGIGYAFVAVRQMRPYPYTALPSSTHAFNSIFKPGNHTPFADSERILFALLNDVSAVQEQAVFNLNRAPSVGNSAIADYQVFILDAATAPVHAKLPNVVVNGGPTRGVLEMALSLRPVRST
jgi:hypothetical protein